MFSIKKFKATKNTKNPTVTVANLTDTKRAGLKLSLTKCVCELKSYKPKLTFKNTNKKINDNYKDGITVVVCTYNRVESLLKTLKSLEEQSFPKSLYDITIVNNGDEIPDKIIPTVLKKTDYNLITEFQKGLSFARNTGSKSSERKYILYIDDDAVADFNLLENVYKAFVNHKKTAIIGGQIFLQPPKPRPEVLLNGKEALWSEYTVPYKKYKEVSKQYEFPYGANFSVSHSVLDEIGGFNVSYGRVGNDYAGGEETLMCFQVLDLGYKIGIEPKAVVYHFVERNRFTKEHIKETIKAGLGTTYRLYMGGYSPSVWDKNYLQRRTKIAQAEVERLKNNNGSELEIFYKECERDGFMELAEKAE